MSNLDLRPYAERLAKAMPERFHVREWCEGDWMFEDIGANARTLWMGSWSECGPSPWSVFGPLLDEFGVNGVDTTMCRSLVRQWTMLEAVCEAVCKAAEVKAKEVGK